ncbi:unnamed protein product [Toxocara canis]|uniref:CNNM transmembrane domain-containing protein n=1 Tax=Toxocara canis TaxID=6265 RepID=A0A183VH79_TOXCA|nr:unnamed protein product [Toxocara canis]
MNAVELQRGLIVSNGEHYLVHPHFTNVSSSHVIHKHAKDDPFPEDRLVTSIFGGSSDRLAAMKELELVVELAVFIDDALWMHFQKLYDAEADSELQKFVLAVVNNVTLLILLNSFLNVFIPPSYIAINGVTGALFKIMVNVIQSVGSVECDSQLA